MTKMQIRLLVRTNTHMLIKTVRMAAARYGLMLKRDAENGEPVYLIETKDGRTIAGANDLDAIYEALPRIAGDPEATAQHTKRNKILHY